MPTLASTRRPILIRLLSPAIGVVLFSILGANLLFLCWYPVSNGISRLGVLVSAGGALAIGLLLIWKYRRLRYAFLTTAAGLGLTFLLSLARGKRSDQLHGEIVKQLLAHENTPYVWGGENMQGIDCSGLPRNALRRASFKRSIAEFRGRLTLVAFDHWLYDSSAKALGDEYRDNTRTLFAAPSIVAIDHSRVRPGDIAITDGGVHALCYLGNHRWIHASPDSMRVTIEDARSVEDGWFHVPVKIVRWQILEDV